MLVNGRRLPRLSIAILLLAATAGCSRAERFPDAPIVLVCPWAAGGGTDRVARLVAALLEKELDVPVNVMNATGGEGVTGHSRGALARADGHTLTMVTVEIGSLHWRGMTTIGHGDFAPVGLVNEDAAAVFVRADAQWQSLRALEQAIRGAPHTLRASGTAAGGIWHLALGGWLSAVGLQPGDVIWVSIAGSAPSMQELLAGGVDIVVTSLAEAQALLSSGRVRSLGVMADSRSAQFPDVPTFKELGVDWEIGTIRGIAVPRDTPADRVAVLSAALKRVVEGDEYQTTMRRAGFTPAYEDAATFSATLARTDQQLGAILTSDAFRGLGSTRFGPNFFPGLLGVAMALVALALVFGARRTRGVEPRDADSGPPAAAWRFASVLIGIAIYLALAETLGFVVTAGALLVTALLAFGTRPTVAIPTALLLVPTVYHVFAVLLRVPLPRGLIGW